jgi:hypothetical protein
MRRVIVKARYVKFKGPQSRAGYAHLRYLQRDGVSREGEPAKLYGRGLDVPESGDFLDRSADDPHQFRIIVAPEDGAALGQLKGFIRHGMAREMRKRKVPKEQISIFLGHLPKDSDAITSIYAPYDPEYCSEAVAAIEDVMAEIRKDLKRANIDQPAIDAATLARAIPSKVKRGVGDAKREEIRLLILSGLPHKEVVMRAKVSSGTVSLIRQEIRSFMPLYRNSESALCVPFACHEGESSSLRDGQVIEKIGGPGWIRTSDLTVMSGQL